MYKIEKPAHSLHGIYSLRDPTGEVSQILAEFVRISYKIRHGQCWAVSGFFAVNSV